MLRLLERFRKDTHGAVTVDWIVLSAGVLALGVGAASLIFDGSSDLGEAIRTSLNSDPPQATTTR
ncbi:MAG: hypothetical protein AAF714_10565 [Pseudomonadota bacterium]